jgi:hypothetical protein
MTLRPFHAIAALVALFIFNGAVAAQERGEAPVADALSDLGADVQVYNDHVVTLSSPFMEGRLPGTRGMEIAMEYCEFWLKKAGLEPAFPDADGNPRVSWRQPFQLSGTWTVKEQSFSHADVTFTAGEDYSIPGYGVAGTLEGELVFVGYGVAEGPDGYRGFPEGTDLSGKIAVLLRFEPMDAEGRSAWNEGRRGWTAAAQYQAKFDAVMEHGAAAIVIVNPPESSDRRANSLTSMGRGTRTMVDVPVLHVSTDAGDRLVQAADAQGRSLLELRKLADAAGTVIPLTRGLARLQCDMEFEGKLAENVGGVVPGKGKLAGEVIVLGAHLDHLGMGNFSSRAARDEQGKLLHPGADDNASGSAAVLMIAERIKRDYDQLPPDADARTVLFLLFSAEESGLIGASHYTRSPIVPIEDHALMVNFDMIGRILNRRLSVSGLEQLVQPMFDASPLEIVTQQGVPPNSDHYSFYQAKVPVLFGIIADFHDDYHTPRDVSSKINRKDAVETVYLFHDVVRAAALRGEPFHFQEAGRGNRPSPRAAAESEEEPATRRAIGVRFGIQPGTYDENTQGIPVAGVTEGAPAAKAGIEAGDKLVKWNDDEIGDVVAWMQMLMKHKPGDEVNVTVDRGGVLKVFKVTLEAPPSDGGR